MWYIFEQDVAPFFGGGSSALAQGMGARKQGHLLEMGAVSCFQVGSLRGHHTLGILGMKLGTCVTHW
jgi:hypothetical protein